MSLLSAEKTVSKRVISLMSFFLLAGLFIFPFTIAGSNFCFALLLINAFIYPSIIQQGWHVCWHEYRHISIGILLYMLLTLLGTLWSDDTKEALRLLSKLIYWLLIPLIIGLHQKAPPQLLKYAFVSTSMGLFFHLTLSTLQYFEVLMIQQSAIGGTSASDPSGLLGHLSFGFIYGIWIGALLIQASITQGKLRLLYYIISTYAVASVFLTQGRSGYLITIALIILVLWKTYLRKKSITQIIILLIFGLGLVSLSLTVNTAGKHKLEQTVSEVQDYIHGHFEHANTRLKIWRVTLDIWQESPFLGIGTGDYRQEFDKKIQLPEYASYKMKLQSYNHPHNEFLFSLVRWGILGILVFIYFIYAWINTGFKQNWEKHPLQSYLITSSGLAVFINSFSDSGLTALTTTIFAILALSFGLSINKKTV